MKNPCIDLLVECGTAESSQARTMGGTDKDVEALLVFRAARVDVLKIIMYYQSGRKGITNVQTVDGQDLAFKIDYQNFHTLYCDKLEEL